MAAIAALERAVGEDATHTEAFERLSETDQAAGRQEQALAAAERAAQTLPASDSRLAPPPPVPAPRRGPASEGRAGRGRRCEAPGRSTRGVPGLRPAVPASALLHGLPGARGGEPRTRRGSVGWAFSCHPWVVRYHVGHSPAGRGSAPRRATLREENVIARRGRAARERHDSCSRRLRVDRRSRVRSVFLATGLCLILNAAVASADTPITLANL